MIPRFADGDWVRISLRTERRHHRVPAYAKGQVGVVERVCDDLFHPPEEIAFGDAGCWEHVYRVRLRQTDLWPEYGGPEHDCLELEIFEHWLEAADE